MIESQVFQDDISIHKREGSFDRLSRARKKHIVNLVDYIKNHVNKLTEKFNKSEENLKKLQETRNLLLKSKNESRDSKLQRIQIKRQSKSPTSKRFYEAFIPSKKQISRSISLPRIQKDQDLNSQDLDKITEKLNSSFNRAQLHKKSISASASQKIRKVNPEFVNSLSDQQYRRKLEIFINKQEQVNNSKKEQNEKIVSKLKQVNKNKLKAHTKSIKLRNSELKQTEQTTLAKISSESVKLENLKKSRVLQAHMSAERWKVKKESQLSKLYQNKRLNFQSKEKIIEKALKSHQVSSDLLTPNSHDISQLKLWRDSEIYKLKCRLLKCGL